MKKVTLKKMDYLKFPKSRAEALKTGSRGYFTGKPCQNGHIAPRYSITGRCSGCNTNKEYERIRYRRRVLDPNYVKYKIEWARGAGKESKRDTTLRRKYGIDLARYKELLSSQGGVCKICKKLPGRTLAVDHCHKSKEVRGLLCVVCNTLVGVVEKKSDVLDGARKYLEEHKSKRGRCG